MEREIQLIEPIKVRLSMFEVAAVYMVMREAAQAPIRNNLKIENILLREAMTTWQMKVLKADDKKARLYSISASIARVLHLRLQQLPADDACQSLLVKLDQELTNRGLKPPFPITLL